MNTKPILFQGWCGSTATNAEFLIQEANFPKDCYFDKLLVAFEGKYNTVIDKDALYACHGYKSLGDLQDSLGKGLRFISYEYSPLLDRSLYLYEFCKNEEDVILAFPVAGERHLEIYGVTIHGTFIHLYDREFCCK